MRGVACSWARGWVCGLPLLAVVACVGLTSCTPGNAKLRFLVEGTCAACPPERLDTTLRQVRGVVELRRAQQQQQLTVYFDSVIVSEASLVALITDMGYTVGDEVNYLPTLLDPCCSERLRAILDTTGCQTCGALGEELSFPDLLDGLDDTPLDDQVLNEELEGVLDAELLGRDLGGELELELDLEDILGPDLEAELEAVLPPGGGL